MTTFDRMMFDKFNRHFKEDCHRNPIGGRRLFDSRRRLNQACDEYEEHKQMAGAKLQCRAIGTTPFLQEIEASKMWRQPEFNSYARLCLAPPTFSCRCNCGGGYSFRRRDDEYVCSDNQPSSTVRMANIRYLASLIEKNLRRPNPVCKQTLQGSTSDATRHGAREVARYISMCCFILQWLYSGLGGESEQLKVTDVRHVITAIRPHKAGRFRYAKKHEHRQKPLFVNSSKGQKCGAAREPTALPIALCPQHWKRKKPQKKNKSFVDELVASVVNIRASSLD